ncbi:MAG TPA: zinc ribbon domain-containing protein [Tepidisphaeraceae bacterium]|jgi:hypothetical protein|nr:zinc ribbon domain-containing protein [Tepidisphaeraceae bacterium]
MSTSPPIVPTQFDLLCPHCGYDLRGTTSDRCPECGQPIDRTTSGISLIPWTHRRETGLVRAYVRTVWMVVRRPAEVGREVAKPVLYADAVRFRALTVVVVLLILLSTVGVVWWGADAIERLSAPFQIDFDIDLFGNPSSQTLSPWMDLLLPVAAGWLVWLLAPIYVLVMLIGCTGVASYLFRPDRLSVQQQNRAVALSCYAAAPLALLFFPVLVLAIVLLLISMDPQSFNSDLQAVIGFLTVLGALMLVAILFKWWLGTLRILRWATQPTGGALLLAGLFLPTGWIVVAVLSLIVLPAVVGFFKLVIASLK